jgi:hypothetical protein
MTDDEFIARFEDCTLEPFRHRDHVRVAWLYLDRYAPAEALARVCEGIRRFAAAHGAPDRYHETITWAFVLLIADRRARAAAGQTWEGFARENADLVDRGASVLGAYYRGETLASDLARRHFVFPDVAAARA